MPENPNAPAWRFVETVAALWKDGESVSGDDSDPFDMTGDDAYDTLHSLISEARALLGRSD
jgi:hypothetical protein